MDVHLAADIVLWIAVAASVWHNLRGCPGQRVAQDWPRWQLGLQALVDEVVERTKRLERVRSQVQRERGIIEKHQKAREEPENGARIEPADEAWLRSFAAGDDSPE
jgi:hypothetical protein